MACALTASAEVPGLEPIVVGGGRLGDVRHVFADAGLARERLGFRAEEPFAAGMSEFRRAPLR